MKVHDVFNRIRKKLLKINPCLQKDKTFVSLYRQKFKIDKRILGAGTTGIYIYNLEGDLVGGVRKDTSGVIWRIGRKGKHTVDCEIITTDSYLLQTIEKFVGTKLTHEVFQ